MKRVAKLTTMVAVILAVIFCFSGCGLAEFTRSLISNDTSDSNNENTGATTPDGTQNPKYNVNSAGVYTTTPSKSTGNTQTQGNYTTYKYDGNDSIADNKTDTTNSNTDNNANDNESTSDNTTQSITQGNTGIKEEPVKDIQDLLFATDPNTASKIMTIAGFEYDEKQGIFYSQMNPLQREFGFNFVYDTAAPMVGMVYDTERLEFVYKGKEWMIQLWKGQYGITAGAEIGLYSRDPDRAVQYDCADDEELILMQYDFYNMGEYVFSRGPEKHWWLTGFKVFHVGIPFMITMDMTLKFTDNAMASAFLRSLQKAQKGANALLNPINYKRTGSTIRIIWGSVPDGIEVKNGKIV